MALKKHPLRDRLREKVLEAVVEKGGDRAAAEKVLDEMSSDRPLLDWMRNGGFIKLVELVLELIAILK